MNRFTPCSCSVSRERRCARTPWPHRRRSEPHLIDSGATREPASWPRWPPRWHSRPSRPSPPPRTSSPHGRTRSSAPARRTCCRRSWPQTFGNVTNAQALTAGGSGSATLTWDGTGVAPFVILDYGPVVGGLPYFTVDSSSGDVGRPHRVQREPEVHHPQERVAAGASRLAVGAQTVYVTNTTHHGRRAVARDRQRRRPGVRDDPRASACAAVTTTAFAPIAAGATNVEVTTTNELPRRRRAADRHRRGPAVGHHHRGGPDLEPDDAGGRRGRRRDQHQGRVRRGPAGRRRPRRSAARA